MSNVNWGTWTQAIGSIKIPTYGNYGGKDFTGGVVTGSGKLPNSNVKGVDPLDDLFKQHDQQYENAANLPGLSDSQRQAIIDLADLQLTSGIDALKNDPAWNFSASIADKIYAGLAEEVFLDKLLGRALPSELADLRVY